MIYYLPERIYDILKNDDDVVNSLLELEEKFETYTDFKSYIKGYSRLDLDPSIRELYIKTNNLIRNKLHGLKFLQKEFDINNGDVNIEEMERWFFYGNEYSGIDLENKFFLLSNIINKSVDHNIYEQYMERYVQLYESNQAQESLNELSKYIHLKYMYSKMYSIAMHMDNLEDFNDNWITTFINKMHNIYLNCLNISEDKDITANYYLESLATAVKRMNYNREQLNLTDINWIQDVLNYITIGLNDENNNDLLLFQYEFFSVGYLFVLDEIATLYCLNGDSISFNYVLEHIISYINRALCNEKILLRGLSFYDKVNHNMFICIIRKYLKILAAINTNLNINELSDEDKRYALSNDLGDISAALPNKLQEKRTVASVDLTAEAMIRKILEIE